MNHSQHVEHLCLRLDMLVIVVSILGDLALGIYLIFWCGTLARNIDWSLVSSSQCARFSLTSSQTRYLSLTIFLLRLIDLNFWDVYYLHNNVSEVPRPEISALPSGDVRGYWCFRCCSFDHGFNIFGMSLMMRKAFPYTLAKAGLFLSGSWFYAVSLPISHARENLSLIYGAPKTGFPESQCPGKFDLCGSHSIFHILVVCATVVQLVGYLEAFDYAQANLTCSSP